MLKYTIGQHIYHIQFLNLQISTVALSMTDGAPAPQRIGAFNFAGVGFNKETGKGYEDYYLYTLLYVVYSFHKYFFVSTWYRFIQQYSLSH